MSHRREILKHYIMALIAEGYLEPAGGTTVSVMRKLAAAMKEDAGGALQEVAEWIFQNAAQHYTEKLTKKVESFVGDIAKRGFGAIWKDIRQTYARGVDAERKR